MDCTPSRPFIPRCRMPNSLLLFPTHARVTFVATPGIHTLYGCSHGCGVQMPPRVVAHAVACALVCWVFSTRVAAAGGGVEPAAAGGGAQPTNQPEGAVAISLGVCATVGAASTPSEWRIDCASRNLRLIPVDMPEEAHTIDMSSNDIESLGRGKFTVSLVHRVLLCQWFISLVHRVLLCQWFISLAHWVLLCQSFVGILQACVA